MSTGRFPDGKYEAGSTLLDFAVQKESGKIFLLDRSGTASVFDLSGQNCVFSYKFEDADVDRMFLIPANDEKMIVCDGFSVYLFDWKQGAEVWRKDLWKNNNGKILEPKMAGALMRYAAVSKGMVAPDTVIPVAAALSPDGTMLALDRMNDKIEIVDMSSGRTVKILEAGIYTMEPGPLSAWQKILWSDDQKYIAAAYMDEYVNQITLAIFDVENETARYFDTEVNWFNI